MRKWILKAIVQKAISFFPFSQRINFFFQKYVTKGVFLSDQYFEDRLVHCANHFSYFQKYNSGKTNFSHLEVGSGWYPVIPIGMFLYGADSITTIDLARLMNEKLLQTTLKKFLEYHTNGKLKKIVKNISEERLALLVEEATGLSSDYYTLLDKFKITYMVMDARKMHLPDHSIDLITSNNTFEHIYPETLKQILVEFKRVIKPGGVMSHAIDLSDHFAHFDKSITIYNYLKFSEAEWRWIDNSIQPQNRMRIYHYRELYKALSIPLTQEINREIDLETYKKVKVNELFLSHSPEENAVSHSSLISVI